MSNCDVWVEVNRDALTHNFNQVKDRLEPATKLMAVVKGNAFGHGYVEAAKVFEECGADMLGVTRLDEGLILRDAYVKCPILLFLPIQSDNAEEAVANNFDITVTSLGLARACDTAAKALGKTARVHIKIDTGMGRLGAYAEDAIKLAMEISALKNVKIAGIYTHFATAYKKDMTHTQRQLDIFLEVLEGLRRSGIDYGLAHAANSSAMLKLPLSHLDMVRVGTVLYGQYPSKFMPRIKLENTWKLKAVVNDVRKIKAGNKIGYGLEYTAKKDMVAAVIGVGYADGLSMTPLASVYRQTALKLWIKKLRYKPNVILDGKRVPIVGRIAMQIIIADVTSLRNIEVGAVATIPCMRIPTNPLIPRIYV